MVWLLSDTSGALQAQNWALALYRHPERGNKEM